MSDHLAANYVFLKVGIKLSCYKYCYRHWAVIDDLWYLYCIYFTLVGVSLYIHSRSFISHAIMCLLKNLALFSRSFVLSFAFVLDCPEWSVWRHSSGGNRSSLSTVIIFHRFPYYFTVILFMICTFVRLDIGLMSVWCKADAMVRYSFVSFYYILIMSS